MRERAAEARRGGERSARAGPQRCWGWAQLSLTPPESALARSACLRPFAHSLTPKGGHRLGLPGAHKVGCQRQAQRAQQQRRRPVHRHACGGSGAGRPGGGGVARAAACRPAAAGRAGNACPGGHAGACMRQPQRMQPQRMQPRRTQHGVKAYAIQAGARKGRRALAQQPHRGRRGSQLGQPPLRRVWRVWGRQAMRRGGDDQQAAPGLAAARRSMSCYPRSALNAPRPAASAAALKDPSQVSRKAAKARVTGSLSRLQRG